MKIREDSSEDSPVAIFVLFQALLTSDWCNALYIVGRINLFEISWEFCYAFLNEDFRIPQRYIKKSFLHK